MTSHRFLAFVEDVSATNSVAGESSEAGKVIDPTHLVWLDGIEEAYFTSLSWIGTSCNSNSQSDRDQRRDHLNSLDPNKLSVFLLALHKDDNSAFYEELAEGAWLKVNIFNTALTDSMPGLQSADYEQKRIDTVWIVLKKCSDRGLLSKLRNVFNLDHLEEANFYSHELNHYQFIPYKNPKFVITEVDVGTEPDTQKFVRRPREV